MRFFLMKWDRTEFFFNEIKQNQIHFSWDETELNFYFMRWDRIRFFFSEMKQNQIHFSWDETELNFYFVRWDRIRFFFDEMKQNQIFFDEMRQNRSCLAQNEMRFPGSDLHKNSIVHKKMITRNDNDFIISYLF